MGPETAPPRQSAPMAPHEPPQHRRLMRSSRERIWAGVAGGIGEYFDVDAWLVRLVWIALTFVSHGLAIGVYILAWIVLPRDDRTPTPSAGPSNWHAWSE